MERAATFPGMLAALIPGTFFEGIPQNWLLWLISGGAVALLVFGADRAVSGAVRLAAALGMSTVIIGATVVSLGTTSPEAFTSVTAAIQGKPGLALGNGVGSIICDTALVFGLSCLLTRLPRDRFVLYRHGVLWLAAGTLLALTVGVLAVGYGFGREVVEGVEREVLNRKLGRGIGGFYLLLLVGYMCVSVHWARRHPETIRPEAKVRVSLRHPVAATLLNLLLVAIGLGLVVLGSSLLVGSVSVLCTRYGVPPDVLAVTVVAFGTSLPELVTAVTAVRKGHGELAIGNVIGADILNVLFVIGASAVAVPLVVPTTFVYFHLPVMMVALTLMGVFIFTGGATFRRWQGLPLLGLYAGYLALLFVRFGGAR